MNNISYMTTNLVIKIKKKKRKKDVCMYKKKGVIKIKIKKKKRKELNKNDFICKKKERIVSCNKWEELFKKDIRKENNIKEEDLLEIEINNDILDFNTKRIDNFLNKNTKQISTFKKIFESKESKLLLKLIKRKVPNSMKYLVRLAKEIQLITYFDFVLVFLQVSKILELTKGIPHIIRGSAGSCLLCFLMKITDIDPIKEKISLSRFMHKDRKSIPDIDIDFPAHLRDGIYNKIFSHWGDTVARISNHIMYKEKSAMREAIRKKGYNKFIKRDFDISSIFPNKEDQREIENIKNKLIGNFRCHSLHCGGIIILKSKIPKNLILKDFKIDDNSLGKQIWMNKDQVEDAGMIKIDILSNNGLSQLLEIDNKDIYEYDFNNSKIWEYLSKENNNLGIIYAESRGMNKIFQTMKISCLNDLATALALIRPSAAKNGKKAGFLRDYMDIDFKNKDYKYLIYDDDATFYIKGLLNCNEAVADNFRRGFSKNNVIVKKKFFKELYKIGKKNKEVQEIKDKLEQLKYYGFCKSHAYSYARLVYVLAYHKYYNPKKFWVATLNYAVGTTYRKWVHFREAKNSGINLRIGKRPFYLLKNNLLGSKNIISKLVYKDKYDFLQNGYWIGNDFI